MRRWGPLGGYVTGRVRVNGEMNGKSANVNNCLRNYIFAKWVAPLRWRRACCCSCAAGNQRGQGAVLLAHAA